MDRVACMAVEVLIQRIDDTVPLVPILTRIAVLPEDEAAAATEPLEPG